MGEPGVLAFIEAQLFIYQKLFSYAQQRLAILQKQNQELLVREISCSPTLPSSYSLASKFGTGESQGHQHNWLKEIGFEDLPDGSDTPETMDDLESALDTSHNLDTQDRSDSDIDFNPTDTDDSHIGKSSS